MIQVSLVQEAMKPIPGFHDYLITESGRVWSMPRRGRKGLWLKPDIHKHGYLRVSLHKDGKSHRFLVHRLVARAWIGPAPFQGAKVLHKDDNPSNNHVDNLYYGTQVNNMRDAIVNGKWTKGKHTLSYGTSIGEKNGNSKLSAQEASEIKELIRRGTSDEEISRMFSISKSTSQQIRHKKTWRHVA